MTDTNERELFYTEIWDSVNTGANGRKGSLTTANIFKFADALLAHKQTKAEPIYLYREIGESGWKECNLSWHEYCTKSPELDCRKLFTEPPQTQEVNDALEEAIYILQDKIGSTDETPISDAIEQIRALIDQPAEQPAQSQELLDYVERLEKTIQLVHDQLIEGKAFTQQCHPEPYWRYEVENAIASKPTKG